MSAPAWGFIVLLVCMSSMVPVSATSKAETAGERTGPSGLPLPRYVSLKSDRVNMRAGPGLKYPTKWVYRRAGLPVEVLREYEGWREVRDAEGVTGWVIGSLLSGRRTALIMPWERKAGRKTVQVELKSDDRTDAGHVAQVEAGVIANVRSCDGRWCAVSVGDIRGYLQQKALWGVYPNETVR
ncbi:MAG: SH3 domain-containing protein [Hyphomicrobiaceae bacterium]